MSGRSRHSKHKTLRAHDFSSTETLDSEEEVFEVESILSKKIDVTGGVSYLVKWKGFPLDKATWEPRDNCSCEKVIKNFEETISELCQPSKRAEKQNKNKSNTKGPKQSNQGPSTATNGSSRQDSVSPSNSNSNLTFSGKKQAKNRHPKNRDDDGTESIRTITNSAERSLRPRRKVDYMTT